MIQKEYTTDRLILCLSTPKLAKTVTEYYLRNREFTKAYSPSCDVNFFTLKARKAALKHDAKMIYNDEGYRFWIFLKDSYKLIGFVNLSCIVRGSFQSCFMGYQLDKDELCKGYMTEAVKKAVEIGFNDIKLHRIEANIMPRNIASLKVTEKAGFFQEGLSKQYLEINGVWEDHIHNVVLNENLDKI